MRPRSLLLCLCALALVLGSTACTAPLPLRARQALLPADILLLGEQHDAPEHQTWEKDTVQWLAQRGELAALVLEMAEQGRSTQALAPDASEAAVQKALYWNDAAWPWAAYGPVAMAAVREGVPVLGGNLPRKRLNATTTDTALDAQLPAAAWQRQQQAVREGHCDLLPEKMLPGMVRVQIARDLQLAHTAAAAVQRGKVVVVVAGVGHVQRTLGVPLYLPKNLVAKVAVAQAGQALAAIEEEADWVHQTPALPAHDACAPLRQQWPGAAGTKPQ
ncbi:ChaN family lipoprotein [Simplicispira psychrophila]|uniref:ChaN family lipoprotein n=1 Tax=Simplicispira psychrophila TaxID=80882 RepID=UPI000481E1CB|nr:ChaN family lipoprotein [Simplicispira psychrophila]